MRIEGRGGTPRDATTALKSQKPAPVDGPFAFLTRRAKRAVRGVRQKRTRICGARERAYLKSSKRIRSRGVSETLRNVGQLGKTEKNPSFCEKGDRRYFTACARVRERRVRKKIPKGTKIWKYLKRYTAELDPTKKFAGGVGCARRARRLRAVPRLRQRPTTVPIENSTFGV